MSKKECTELIERVTALGFVYDNFGIVLNAFGTYSILYIINDEIEKDVSLWSGKWEFEYKFGLAHKI